MTKEEIEKCFDFPIKIEDIQKLSKKMKEDGWKIDDKVWLQTENISFYKGMYATVRVIFSIVKDPSVLEFFSGFSLDLIFIIGKLNEMSNIEG